MATALLPRPLNGARGVTGPRFREGLPGDTGVRRPRRLTPSEIRRRHYHSPTYAPVHLPRLRGVFSQSAERVVVGRTLI